MDPGEDPMCTICAQKEEDASETRVLTGKFLVRAAGIEPAPDEPPNPPEALEDKGPSEDSS